MVAKELLHYDEETTTNFLKEVRTVIRLVTRHISCVASQPPHPPRSTRSQVIINNNLMIIVM